MRLRGRIHALIALLGGQLLIVHLIQLWIVLLLKTHVRLTATVRQAGVFDVAREGELASFNSAVSILVC